MSFTCEIENKLHKARLNLLNNHIEESMKIFIETLDELEKHKNNCEGEELAWTTSCFNRTLEEFNLIRDTHPDIHIEVMESDNEGEVENPPSENIVEEVTENVTKENIPENIATEEVPAEQPTGLYGDIQSFSKKALDIIKEFDERHHVSSSITEAVQTGKKNVDAFFAEKSLAEHIKDGYNETIEYCKEHQVVEKSVDFVKCAACYVYHGVVYVTSSIAKGVRGLIEKYSAPTPVYTGPPAPASGHNVVEASEQYAPAENVDAVN